MKATGIVRRIDDLGRVVIPKEIRRTMRIREGDPFKKYSPMGDFAEFTAQYAEVLNKATGMPVFISDRDRIVAYSGSGKRDFSDRRISKALETLMEERGSFVASQRDRDTLLPVEGREEKACIAYPVVAGGDVSGAVVALFNQKGDYPAEPDVRLLQVAADFLAKQTED